MADGRGGYQRPSNPAPVSGPGALSRRTDGQPARWVASQQYGEGQEMMDIQQSAPMSKAPAQPRIPRAGAASAGAAVPQGAGNVVPLFAPTNRPDEPVTAGAPFGPGRNPTETTRGQRRSVADSIQKLLPYDDSGSLQMFYRMAVKRGW